jgi:hypothetical protein
MINKKASVLGWTILIGAIVIGTIYLLANNIMVVTETKTLDSFWKCENREVVENIAAPFRTLNLGAFCTNECKNYNSKHDNIPFCDKNEIPKCSCRETIYDRFILSIISR